MCELGPEVGHSYLCVQPDDENSSVAHIFTFLNQFDRSWKHAGEFEAGVILTVFLLSSITNVVVLWLILKSKDAKSVTNYFVCNLMIADLAYIFTAPFVASGRLTSSWKLGHGLCSFIHYWLFVCASSIIWTLAFISIDRYVNINMGVSTIKRLNKWHIIALCAAIWLIGILSFLPVALFSSVVEAPLKNNTVKVCSLIWPDGEKQSTIFHTSVIIVDFLIPVVIISMNYFRIYRKYINSRRAIESFSNGSTNTSQTPRINNKSMRIVKTLIILVVAFIVMWTPTVIVFYLIERDNDLQLYQIPSSALVWSTCIAYGNGVVNAGLYGFSAKQMRAGVQKIRERITTHVDNYGGN